MKKSSLILLIGLTLVIGGLTNGGAEKEAELAISPARDGTVPAKPHPLGMLGRGEHLGSKGSLLTEGFESWPPTGWEIDTTESTNNNPYGYPTYWEQYSTYSHSGVYSAGLWWSESTQDEWLKTPSVTLTGSPANTYYLSFWPYAYYGSTYGDHYYVLLSTDGGTTWSDTLLDFTDDFPSGQGWNYFASKEVIDISTYANQSIKIAWNAYAIGGLWYAWLIDDVEIYYPPGDDMACISIDNPADGTAFTGGSTVTIQATVRNEGTDTQNNVAVTVEVDDGAKSIIYTQTGYTGTLNQNDTELITFTPDWTVPDAWGSYTITVYTALGGDEDASNDTLSITVGSIPSTITCEGFEGTWPPDGWTIVNNDGGLYTWAQSTTSPHSGTYHAESRYETSSLRNDDWLITPPLIISSGDGISFWYSSSLSNDSLEVRVSTTGTSPAQFTDLLWATHITSSTYAQQFLSLNAYANDTVWVAFVNKGLYLWRIRIDDVCMPPIYVMGNDMATVSIDNPADGAALQGNSAVTVQATVKNAGANTQNNVPVTVQIDDGSKAVIYTDTKYTGSLSQDQTEVITFTPDWTVPNAFGAYSIKVYTELAGDDDVGNDTLTINVTSIPAGYTFESFESTTFPPVYPEGAWVQIGFTSGYTQGWNRSSGSAYHGSYKAYSRGQNSWLFTPRLTVGTGDGISFWYRAESASYPVSFKVRLSTSPSQTDTSAYTVTLADFPLLNSTTYQQASIDLSGY